MRATSAANGFHDSRDLSEFALHVRAILGLPIGEIEQRGPGASAVLLGEGRSDNLRFDRLAEALAVPDTQLRLSAKPDIDGCRASAWRWRGRNRSRMPSSGPRLPRRRSKSGIERGDALRVTS